MVLRARGAAAARRLRWVRSLSWSLAVIAVAVATVTLLLLQGARPLVGRTTPAIAAWVPLASLAPGDQVIQTVPAVDDRMSQLQITFGTYFGTARCDLLIELRRSDGDPLTARGPVVAARHVACADLPDSSPFPALTFRPIEGSSGQQYDVVVTRVDHGTGAGVVVWSGHPLDGTALAVVDGTQVGTAAMVRPLYDPRPRWLDDLEVVFTRMAAYGPGWGSTGPFVALLVVLVLAVAAVPWVMRRRPLLLGLVVLAALARGLLWAAVVPAFAGVDEPAHFSNVQHIAVEHDLTGRPSNHAAYSEQITTAMAELHVTADDPGDRPPYTHADEQRVTALIDAAATTGGGGGPAAAYPPPYYAGAAVAYDLGDGSFFGSVMAARMWSVLLGVAGAVLFALIGARLFPDRPVAQVAFALAGLLQPMAGQQFAIVNNDAWVMVCGFLGFLVSLDLTRRGRAPWLSLSAGLVLGAGLLGKPFAIAIAVPLVVGWAIGKARHRVRDLRLLAGEIGLMLLGVAATYGTWRVVAVVANVPPQTIDATGGARSVRVFVAAVVGHGAAALRRMWSDQVWGDFGWIRIPYSPAITWPLLAVALLVALGLVVWAGALVRRGAQLLLDRRRGAVSDRAPDRTAIVETDVRLAVVAGQLAGIVGALYSAAWIYYVATGNNDLLQGRYALLALPAILAAPVLLVERVAGRRASTFVVLLLAAAMLVLTIVGLNNALRGFYA